MKKFAGFTPQQQYTLLTKQGYVGPADEASMAKFLAASPAAASKMGEYAQIAQQRLAGRPMPSAVQMAEGGVAAPAAGLDRRLANARARKAQTPEEKARTAELLERSRAAEEAVKEMRRQSAGPADTSGAVPPPVTRQPVVDTPQVPTGSSPQAAATMVPQNSFYAAEYLRQNPDVAKAGVDPYAHYIQYGVTEGRQAPITPTAKLMQASIKDPMSTVPQAQTVGIPEAPGTTIAAGTGQVGDRPDAQVATVGTTSQAQAPAVTPAASMTPTTIAGQTPQATAAQGVVSDKALVEAQQGKLSPEAMAEAAKFDSKFLDKVTSGELQVGSKELVTPAGQNAEAVKAEIAQSEGLADAIAEQGSVQPEELPQPALIAEEDMAQAQAITAEGLAPDAVAVAARLEKFSVDNETLAEAMQGEVNALDTVQGQLTQLMKSFDDGQTPAWAAGAIRAANAVMAARGVGGSSMAGAAIFQAAMESALPIAAQDAQVFQQMNLANLNNRQQVALANAAAQQGLQLQNLNNEQQAALQNSANAFALQSQNLSNMQQTMLANAQIKAALQGQNLSNQQQSNLATAARYAESANINLNNRQQTTLQNNSNALNIELANLSNRQQSYIANAQLEAALQAKKIEAEQQAAIANAARYAEAANVTFNAEQQAKLHNSELLKTAGLAELNAQQAATLQNAANLANMDVANLNNRQQAAVQNAQAFLQTDLTNLTNAQQTAIFNTQAKVNTLLSDQAAENAAKQFNAASENQTNQFFSELNTTVSRFNAEQSNAIKQFNAGETNATEKFNAQLQSLRDQFNANNSLVIAQANAQWRQTIATADTAAQNEAAAQAAKVANGFTQTTIDQIWQRERDIMSSALTTAEGDADRLTSLMLGEMTAASATERLKAGEQAAKSQFFYEAGKDVLDWLVG